MTAADQLPSPTFPVRNVAANIGPSSLRCAGCNAGHDGIGRREWLSGRAWALRHVRRTGHVVVANVGHVYTYAPAPRD